MAKRNLPPSEVLSSTKDEGKLPKKQWDQQRSPKIADELNRQRIRPVYDEKKP